MRGSKSARSEYSDDWDESLELPRPPEDSEDSFDFDPESGDRDDDSWLQKDSL